jgi:hypothetical protein
MPATRKTMEIINSPKYGNLQSILAVYHMKVPDNGAAVLKNRETPNWLRNGVHPLSFMNFCSLRGWGIERRSKLGRNDGGFQMELG